MKKPNKDHVNLTIDPEKRALFDSLQPIHGKTLSDILDEALDSVIGDVSPDVLLEMSIKETELKLAEMKENLIEARYLAKKQQARKNVEIAKEAVMSDLDSRLEDLRNSKYEETKTNLAFMYKKRTIDWKVIMSVFEFSSQADAKDFVTRRLLQDHLIS